MYLGTSFEVYALRWLDPNSVYQVDQKLWAQLLVEENTQLNTR